MESLALFQHQVTPYVLGIIWLTEEEFSPALENYYSLNYLLDGLFSSQITNTQTNTQTKKQSKKLFITESFGRTFFVGHVQKASNQKKEIEKILTIAERFEEPQGSQNLKETILFLDETNTLKAEEWQKQYPLLKFEKLIIEL